ncbi:hypothetical protein BH11PSE11_BH11PSE11_33350 [soil metagenome]
MKIFFLDGDHETSLEPPLPAAASATNTDVVYQSLFAKPSKCSRLVNKLKIVTNRLTVAMT